MQNTQLMLEELFDNGFVTKEIKLDKYPIKLKTLSAKDYIDISSILYNGKPATASSVQVYALHKLAKGLVEYNGKSLGTTEEAVTFLESLPAILVDTILKKQAEFEKEVAALLSPDSIEENFFETPGLAKKQEQSHEG